MGFKSVLSILGLSGPVGATPATVLESTRDDVEIEFYDSDWALIGRVEQFDGFKLKKDELGLATCSFTMPLEDLVDLGLYSTACLETIVRVYIRGTEEFVGLVVVCEDDDRTGGASSRDDVVVDVSIEAWVDWHWFMSARDIKGDSGDMYVESSVKPNVGLANLIEANCDDSGGNLVEPTEYATLDGGGAVERDNFGNFAFGSASSGTHPDTITRMMWETGDGLFEDVVEGLRRYNLKVVSSWDKGASPPKCTATITYPREGTDRTSSMIFDRERGALKRFSRTVDRGKECNVAQAQGKGKHTNQVRGYAINEDSYGNNGLRETGDVWPGAWQADVDEEAEFIIQQVGGSATTYKADIQEVEGMEYGSDWYLGDKVTISCSRRNIAAQDYITWIEWSLSGSGPLETKIGLGREEPSETQKSQRGGGGGRGGRRSGGKSKRKSGEPETVRKIDYDSGSVTFDQQDDELDDTGETPGPQLYLYSVASDAGSAEDSNESVERRIYGVYTDDETVTASGYTEVYIPALGRNVRLLTKDPGPSP